MRTDKCGVATIRNRVFSSSALFSHVEARPSASKITGVQSFVGAVRVRNRLLMNLGEGAENLWSVVEKLSFTVRS
jgi:hypothetical protein